VFGLKGIVGRDKLDDMIARNFPTDRPVSYNHAPAIDPDAVPKSGAWGTSQ
jgi:hypothetical protein